MQKFVRGNEIICSGYFVPEDGVSEPASAEAVIKYTNTSGQAATATVALTKDTSTGEWKGAWDSSAASACTVDYVIRCSNGLKAATQGSFAIVANSANV